MLILQGEQGRFKSTAFAVIGGPWYAVATADVDDPKAFAETMRGKMILELAELASFGKAESASIKRLVTTQTDRFRASYGRFAEDHPRRCVLVGTTNLRTVHNDETGGRRFWPVWVERADLAALERDRDQLFAEAVHHFKAGAPWWEMPQSALDAQEAARDRDELEPDVEAYLNDHPEGVSLVTVWTDGLGYPPRDFMGKRHEQVRIAKIMRSLQWQRDTAPTKIDGKSIRLWRPIQPPF
jgi:predicted P-loop ATPase